MTTDLLLSQALAGFILARTADGYSPDTLQQYQWALSRLPDLPLSALTTAHLREVLATAQSGPLSATSVFHIWKAIRAFYKWASAEGLVAARPDTALTRPRYQLPEVIPFTVDELKALLKAVETTRPTHGQRAPFTMRRPLALRDKALILTLLDTGLRASELCRLTVADLNLTAATLTVRPFRSGIKSRGRVLPLGQSAKKILWRFVTAKEPTDPLFAAHTGRPLNRDSLLHLLKRLGDRAAVPDVHPHRFRHTFAIQFLRNGGDVFTLQRLLGHASLEMVRHYLALAQADDEAAHRRASPVDQWRL